jgi:hypothetical protein
MEGAEHVARTETMRCKRNFPVHVRGRRNNFKVGSKHRLFKTFVCTVDGIFSSLLAFMETSGYYMYHQFNSQQFYDLPTHCIYVFCMDLRTNNDWLPIHHWLTGLYNRDGTCLLRGTNWAFKQDLKCLITCCTVIYRHSTYKVIIVCATSSEI